MEQDLAHGAFAFLLYLGCVLTMLRLRLGAEPAAQVLIAAWAIWPLSLAALMALGERVAFWTFCVSYWFLVLGFLMAFGAIYKSISLRIVAELLAAPGRSLPRATLEERLLHDSFRDRLAILVRRGYAEGKDGLVLTARGMRIARRVNCAQRLFRIERSG